MTREQAAGELAQELLGYHVWDMPTHGDKLIDANGCVLDLKTYHPWEDANQCLQLLEAYNNSRYLKADAICVPAMEGPVVVAKRVFDALCSATGKELDE